MNVRIIPALVATLAMSFGVGRSASADYTLYYLDSTHNVCSIGIDSNGDPTGKPKTITTAGPYHSYSVSPDEKTIVASRNTKGSGQMDPWDCYIESQGKRTHRPISRLQGDFPPYVQWTRNSRFAFLSYGYEDFVRVWDVTAKRETADLSANYPMAPSMTADECFMLIMDYTDAPDEDESGSLYAFDPRTGKSVQLGKIMYHAAYYGSNCTWVGKSHTCAFIDTKGNLWAAKISAGKSGTRVSKHQLTKRGGGSDLRATGSGIYFVQKTSSGKTAYYSTDLRTIRPGRLLAPRPSSYRPDESPNFDHDPRLPRSAWRHEAAESSDGALLACPVDAGKGKMPILTIFDKSGNSHIIGPGKMPSWKGTANIW